MDKQKDRATIRRERDGNLLIVLPDVPANRGFYAYYTEIGEHGEMSFGYYYKRTKPVSTSIALKRLEQYEHRFGEKLRLVKRISK